MSHFDPNELPAEVAAFFKQVDPMDRLALDVGSGEAWMLVAILQFATRAPLPPVVAQFAERFGRRLQTAFPLEVQPYLEAGWNPAHDVPVQRAGQEEG